MAQHYLRQEEMEKVLEFFNKGPIAEDQLNSVVRSAKNMVPSNKDGNGLDPEIEKSLKMLLQVISDPEFQKKYSKDFLDDFCEKLFKCIKECSRHPDKKNLPIHALKMVLDTLKALKNNPELEKKLGKDFLPKLTMLTLKFITDPDELSKKELEELNAGLNLVFMELKPQFASALTKKSDAEEKKDIETSEKLKQMAVYDDAGDVLDLLGIFVPGAKACVLLSGILTSGPRDSEEEKLEAMGVIHSSPADKLHHGPQFG